MRHRAGSWNNVSIVQAPSIFWLSDLQGLFNFPVCLFLHVWLHVREHLLCFSGDTDMYTLNIFNPLIQLVWQRRRTWLKSWV